ncbi:MAG: plasmid pRiA4b ORF-3 family protein [Blastocatellia bacterium]|nr:plasmid pRiA4b ORF-3 family protein [Blastocatellia bacterium]
MIYTLTVECVAGAYLKKECIRVIEIDENASLADLHEAIQDAVKFDRDHLYDFYAGRLPRHRKVLFSDDDDWEDRKSKYREITLNQVYPLKNLKLYYFFDYGDSWLFEIKKMRKLKEAEPGRSYPRVIERRGPNPTQYPRWG